MIKNYLASFWRYFAHNSFYSILNVSGLIIGLTTFLILIQYVVHEYSYDNFLKNHDQIFRIQQDRFNKGELSTQWASGCAGIGPDMKASFPEVQYMVRLRKLSSIFSREDRVFREEDIFFAESDFFRIFSIPLLRGVDTLVLKEPNFIVLSESMANKYFPDEDPVGQTITFYRDTEMKISGVFKDLPVNTHMKFDALMSFATYASWFDDPEDLNTWNWDGYMTYIQLFPGSDPLALEEKLPAFVEKEEGENLRGGNSWIEFHLQPVRDIHLDSNFMFEFQANGSRNTVRYLTIIAILVTIIAWINYINLSTARSVERSREVGLRKVLGGVKSQLIGQFMLESLVINTFAILVSILFFALLSPLFEMLTGREMNYLLFRLPGFWLGLLALIFLGTIVSGIYPAFILSSPKAISVLKGRAKSSTQGILLRKGLVAVQFVVSIALITGTFVIYRQVSFLQNQSLGVDLDQTLILNSPGITDSTYHQKFQVFKERVKGYAEVSSVSASTEVPGRQPAWNAGGIRRISQPVDDNNQYRVIMMDEDFIPAYGLEVISGRAFSGELNNEHRNVLMNEAASELMGFPEPEEALNDLIFFWGDTFRIVGVIKNYGQESLKKVYDPTIYRYNQAPGGYYSIKFNTEDVRASMGKFENDWRDVFPGNPFNYFFLDDHYNTQYKADIRFGTLFGIFSSLAIFIACLGLVGLSSLSVIQRTKEIGIRKVLGAGASHIIGLMSREYLILMGIAILLAVPLAAVGMERWLQSFANKIELSWWIFAIPCIGVSLVAFLAISFHTLKAAATHPATTLRYE